MILILITLLPAFARTGSGPSHQGKGDSFPLDGLVRVDFSMKARCRGRFSHADSTILRRETSIRLTILHHLEDTKPAHK